MASTGKLVHSSISCCNKSVMQTETFFECSGLGEPDIRANEQHDSSNTDDLKPSPDGLEKVLKVVSDKFILSLLNFRNENNTFDRRKVLDKIKIL